MKRLFSLYICAFAIVFALCGSVSFAADFFVSATTGSDTLGTGLPVAPWATIQHAINITDGTASDPADIRVGAGTYRENLVMKSYVNLWGGYEAVTWTRDIKVNETIIDGGRLGSCVRFESVEGGSLDGFTIINGTGYNDQGGGIFCSQSSPVIRNNIVKYNWVEGSDAVGGGIYCSSSSATISDNIIGGNSAQSDMEAFGGNGGAIYCSNCSPVIENNVIISNWAASCGGGIHCYNSSPIIRKNIITNNEAYNNEIDGENGGDGGGIDCFNHSSPLIENNIITRNFAFDAGGGINSRNSWPSVRNNLIIHNSALQGGAISCHGSTLTIHNNTICNNSAYYNPVWERGENGGGIFSYNSAISLENNLFCDNSEYAVYQYGGTVPRHNEFHNSSPGIWYNVAISTSYTTIDQVNALVDAEDNISVPPRFRPSLTGVVTGVAPGPAMFQSTLTDSNAAFTPGALAGLIFDVPSWPKGIPIASNTASTITVWGDVTTSVSVGDSYTIFDYHLRSTSELIDAGTDIGAGYLDIDGETRPCSIRFDIGADEHCAQGEGEGEEPWLDEAWDETEELWFDEGRDEIEQPVRDEGREEVEESVRADEVSEGEGEEIERDEMEIEIEEREFLQDGDGDEMENRGEEEGETEVEAATPTPTPALPSINICSFSRLTASTALAGKLEWLREWRDGLLEMKIGETIAAGYYRIQPRKN